MAKKDIVKHQFKKGESGNPKGRPKSTINQVLDDLKAEGAEKVTKAQINDVYTTMLSLTKGQLAKISNDSSKQMLYVIIAKAILSKKGFEVIETMLDRAQGKPTQTQEINQTTELLAKGLSINLPEPDEAFKEKWQQCQNDFEDD